MLQSRVLHLIAPMHWLFKGTRRKPMERIRKKTKHWREFAESSSGTRRKKFIQLDTLDSKLYDLRKRRK